MRGFTQVLAEYLAKTTYDDLPPEVVHQTKRLILDQFSSALGGHSTQIATALRAVSTELGGRPEATVIGNSEKTSCANATYVNSRTANILDWDDTFYTESHFGTAAVFAPLAVCERTGRCGKDLITAVALGFDLAARADITVGNPYMVEDARRPDLKRHCMRQGLVLAAAGGAGKALGLNAEQMAQAIGNAAGNMPFNNRHLPGNPFTSPVTDFKGTDHGWCGMAGLMGALLAQKGLTACSTVLDKESSFWDRFPGAEKDFDLLIGRLGEKWYIMDTTFKLWPSCRYTHPPLTALSKILQENSVRPEEIERVTVWGTSHLAGSGFADRERQGLLSLQFNVPHAVAMLVFGVTPGPDWYSEDVISDTKIKEFKKKVFCEVHPEAANLGRWVVDGQIRKMFGRAELVARGQTFVAETEYSKGDPWSPETYMTDEELIQKFRNAASPLAPESTSWQRRIDEIAETIFALERMGDVRELTGFVTG